MQLGSTAVFQLAADMPLLKLNPWRINADTAMAEFAISERL